jgi:hypothetical protein
MFFRREKPKVPTFNERIDNLKKSGFATHNESGSRVRASRNSIAAVVTDVPADRPHVERAGLAVGNEIGALVNAGYQQYWLTPSKKRVPATAEQLKELHAFEEDLKEALGLQSLYNTSLGTISALHLYDRVEERDADYGQKPWQVRIARD